MGTKELSSIRLTVEAKHLLREIARRSGISMTAVLELAIREVAKREAITLKEPERSMNAAR